ncbi:MAG TPA: sulfatase-like hydrolase/transferase [Geminicoccaceae bacterium]|nr:sulfatase-like hydrolase/transferase [Geminicoccaceae bacterium]
MAFAAALLLPATAADAAPRNILLIIADDFGVDVAEFYPTSVREVTTPPAPPMPNLRALARRGVLFARAWANPWCSPTRATILTGRYGFRTGIGRAWSGERPPLALSEFTLPEAFRAGSDSGYVLANLGKWHLSGGASDPNRQGWAHYAGMPPGAGSLPSYFSWSKTVDGATATSRTYATTDTVNEAAAEIARAEARDLPYFLWVAFAAPHFPFHKPPNALHSRDSLPATGASNRAYFEAMVEALDTEIGRLLRSVELATTTVIFVGDNGTTGSVIESPYPSSKDKGTMYQGGVRVPLLIAGAGVDEPDRLVTQLVNTADLFLTILELAGIDPADGVPAGTRADGVSLLPYMENRAHPEPRAWVYAEQFPTRYDARWQRAIGNARYKLIERAAGLSLPTREFFDLANDPFERTNLLGRTLTATQRTNLTSLDRQLDALLATR